MTEESKKPYKTKTGYSQNIMKYEKIEGYDEPVVALCGFIEYDEYKNKVYVNITKVKCLLDRSKTAITKITNYSQGKVVSYHKSKQDGSYVAKEKVVSLKRLMYLENNIWRHERIAELTTEITVYKYLENTMIHTLGNTMYGYETKMVFII